MKNIGIIQGRLSQPIEGFQECPNDWKGEFDLLPSLGLNHIEWIVTKKSFSNNPLFSEDLSNYPISSICADNLVDSGTIAYIYNTKFLRKCQFCSHIRQPLLPPNGFSYGGKLVAKGALLW